MIRTYVFMIVMSFVILALLIGPILIQGWGRGYERDYRMDMGLSIGMSPVIYGWQGGGMGGSSISMTPQTPEQQALVGKVTNLHNGIRAANQDVHPLKTRNASGDMINQKRYQINVLGSELNTVTKSNQNLH